MSILAKEEKVYTKRLALLIGNSSYPNWPLKNPANDVAAIEKVLKQLNFDVTKYTDLDQKSFEDALFRFEERLDADTFCVFYFAGHGLQPEDGSPTIFVPLDFEPDASNEDAPSFLTAEMVHDRLKLKATTVVFADCCRTKEKTRSSSRRLQRSINSIGRGLVAQFVPRRPPTGKREFESAICFSTWDGRAAFDASFRNKELSVLAEAVCTHLPRKTDLALLLRDINYHIEKTTEGLQNSANFNSLRTPIYLAGCDPSEGSVKTKGIKLGLAVLSAVVSAAFLMVSFGVVGIKINPADEQKEAAKDDFQKLAGVDLTYQKLETVKTASSDWRTRQAEVFEADRGCTTLVCQAVRNWGAAEKCARDVPEQLFKNNYERRVPDTGLFHAARQERSNEVIYMGADWLVKVGDQRKILAYDCHWSLNSDKISTYSFGLYDLLPEQK